MKMFFASLIAALAMFIGLSSASAADIRLGVVGVYSSSPYKGHDDTILPFPLFSYEGERFFFRGAGGGVHVWKGENQEVSIGVSYSGTHFDHKKTDNNRLKRLDDRYSTVTADVYYTVQTEEWGQGGVKASQDILSNSEGFTVDVWYKHPLFFGPLVVSPGVGLQWDSEKQTDYYYGISSREARKSGLDKYDADHSVSPYLSLEVNYAITEHWNLVGGGKVTFLSDEIQDSPMVNTSQTYDASFGVVYSF